MAKTRRVKPQKIIHMRDLGDVDNALLRIAQLKLGLKRIDADAEEAINGIKEQAAKQAKPLLEEIEKLENGIFAFSEYSKDQIFQKKKTVELNFGFIGYRKSTKISVKKSTLDKLKEMGLSEAIIVKESPNKEILATFSDAILKQVDARRIIEEKFWYEVKEEEVTQKTPQQEVINS